MTIIKITTSLLFVFFSLTGCFKTSEFGALKAPSSSSQIDDTKTDESESQIVQKQASAKQIVKALDGGMLPETIYTTLSRKDKIRALEAEYRALEHTKTGGSITWISTNGKITGSVTPAQIYTVGTQTCRHYSHNLIITTQSTPKTQQSSGSACRTEDGKWTPLR